MERNLSLPAQFVFRKCVMIMLIAFLAISSVSAQTETVVFSYSGNTQTFTVPAGVTQLQIKAWGAGGGGSDALNAGGSGGSGAFVKGTLNVNGGQSYIIQVGGPGLSGDGLKNGGYAGGGQGGRNSGSGGGYSGLFLGTAVNQAAARLIAGGGGGGAFYNRSSYGGAGGGTDAPNLNQNILGGKKGSLIEGGTPGSYYNQIRGAEKGSALKGGKGSTYDMRYSDYLFDNGGGGGGGGYYGGGGGVGTNGNEYLSTGGGGGSSYSHTDFTGDLIVGNVGANGNTVAAPGNTETGYVAGVATGGANRNNGGNGLIIITYDRPACNGTPTGGTTVITPTTGASGSNIVATVTGSSQGSTGITYQWQRSIGNTNSWQDISGMTAMNQTLIAENQPPGTKIYYRRAIICTATGATDYSSAAEYTIFEPNYCDPKTFTYNDYYITEVAFIGTRYDFTNSSTFSSNPRGYQDFTGINKYAIQEQGGAVNLSVTNSRESSMVAWVDWDNNGTFSASEKIYNTNGAKIKKAIFGFTVPAGQTPGYYRVRVRVSANLINDNGACTEFNNGETEDYLIQVVASCGAKITGSTTPDRCGPGATSITVNTSGADKVYVYDSETANNPIAVLDVTSNKATYTIDYLPATTAFYFAAAAGSCQNFIRTKITSVIKPLPSVSFDNDVSEFCGDVSGNATLKFSVLGGKEIASLINENFDNQASNLGIFTAGTDGQSINDTYWVNRSSNYQPAGYIQPVVASGLPGNKFAIVNLDASSGNNTARTRYLTSSTINTNGLLNLSLDYDIYAFFEAINNVEVVNVEVKNGNNWVVVKSYLASAGSVGLPSKFKSEHLNLNSYINVSDLQIRFTVKGFGEGTRWSADIVAVDNIALYGEKNLPPTFNWTLNGATENSIMFKEDCITPYPATGGGNQVCIKPTSDMFESVAVWTLKATASLTNGCSAEGEVVINNNNKKWNPNSPTVTNWTESAQWLPTGIPDPTKCVNIPSGKKSVVNIPTAAAKSITVANGGTLNITSGNALTVTNEIINQGNGDNFIVKSDANLLQINEDPNLNTRPISVRRLFTWSDDFRKEYNYLASPVKGQNMKALFGATTNTPFALVLRENTNTFVNASAADYSQPGKGFAVKEPAESFVGGGDITANEGEFKGVPNNGTFTTPITKTVASRGWNLIGNPYPSNLDLQKFYQNNNDKILPEFRFWDNRMNNTYVQYGGAYQGYSYAIYNALSDEGNQAPGGDPGDNSSDPTPTADVSGLYRYAKVGQGFVVRANASIYPSTVHLEYKNTQRTLTQPDRGFFGRNEIQKDRYRLQLITPDSLTMTQTILYIPNGLNSVGLEDSKHPNSNASDAFYSVEETSKLLINAKAPFQITDKVPLGNNHFIAGVYKIRAVNKLGIFANGQAIYLKDKKLNVMADLTQGDYTFTSEAGAFSDRFEIVYQPETVLATEGTTKASLEVYRDAGDFVIRSSEKSIALLELYDASGRLVLSQKGNGKEFRFAATTLAEGMYVVKTRLKDGQELTHKIRNP